MTSTKCWPIFIARQNYCVRPSVRPDPAGELRSLRPIMEIQWLKWGGRGLSPLLQLEPPPCNSMNREPPTPDWIWIVWRFICLCGMLAWVVYYKYYKYYKVLFYAQITPNYLRGEWVWGLLQPIMPSPLSTHPVSRSKRRWGFVRWAPLLHMTTLTNGVLGDEGDNGMRER